MYLCPLLQLPVLVIKHTVSSNAFPVSYLTQNDPTTHFTDKNTCSKSRPHLPRVSGDLRNRAVERGLSAQPFTSPNPQTSCRNLRSSWEEGDLSCRWSSGGGRGTSHSLLRTLPDHGWTDHSSGFPPHLPHTDGRRLDAWGWVGTRRAGELGACPHGAGMCVHSVGRGSSTG